MIGEVVGELLAGAVRLLGRFLVEVVFEFLIKGAGYIVCRLLSRKKPDPDSAPVVVVGVVFWVAVGVGVYALSHRL